MDKVVFITGVFGGIGYATAKCFKSHGWTVLGMDKFNGKDSEAAVDKFFHMDCSRRENVKAAAEYMEKVYGGLDCLVNNAAVQVCESIDDTTEEQWDLVFGSNIRANFLFIKNMHDLLRKTHGNVVNVSSVQKTYRPMRPPKGLFLHLPVLPLWNSQKMESESIRCCPGQSTRIC